MDKKYLSSSLEVEEAQAQNRPVVALESATLALGLPYPENVEVARHLSQIIRDEGAVPALIAVMDGQLRIGLEEQEVERLCRSEKVEKVSRRELPIFLATGKMGATTVATAIILAEMAGLHILATGGIGGVHKGRGNVVDISTDLQELAGACVAVVCAGTKSSLDVGPTLSYLRQADIPIMGLDTQDFPAYYARKSGFSVDFNAGDPEILAWVLYTRWRLGLSGGVIVANPIPEPFELDNDDMELVIRRSLTGPDGKGIRSKDFTKGETYASTLELFYHNAQSAARIAVQYAKAEALCLALNR